MFFDPQDPEVLDFDALGFDELGRSPLSAAGHVYERFDDPEAELVKQSYLQGRARADGLAIERPNLSQIAYPGSSVEL